LSGGADLPAKTAQTLYGNAAMARKAHNINGLSNPPSISDLEGIAQEALTAIPDALRRHLNDVVIRVEDFPDDETMEEMELESPFDLLGLYRGVNLLRRSVMGQSQDVDMIYIYRRPILDYWCEMEEDLVRVVRHVLIHEIGHHFGFSDEDMERIEMSA
jgi:predicted Zn-dependent protease with MMP-like domain